MSKGTKIWLVIAMSLVIFGSILFAAVMSMNLWDFTKLGTITYIDNAYEIKDEFHSISVDVDTTDIVFETSDDEKCKIVCCEEENVKHSVVVQDGVLSIRVVDEREWYEFIGIAVRTAKITVYLPESVRMETVDITADTGDISLKNIVAEQKIFIETDTGDVNFDGCDANEIFVEVDTGDVSGTLLSDKVFLAETDTGEIDVPKTMSGGQCEISTDTGDIVITIK